MNVLEPYQQLEVAIRLSAYAHKDETLSDGLPYITHPLFIMQQFLHDPELAAIAVGHDTIENTACTIDDWYNHGVSDRVLIGLDLISQRPDDTYFEYIARVATSWDTIQVKLADLAHNMDPSRRKVGDNELRVRSRMQRYTKACRILNEAKLDHLH